MGLTLRLEIDGRGRAVLDSLECGAQRRQYSALPWPVGPNGSFSHGDALGS